MKRSLVIGAGVSGKAAVKFLIGQGHEVTLVDRNPEQLKGMELSERVHVCEESEFRDLDRIDEVILSSGVRQNHPFAKGKVVIGEAELALRNCRQRAVAITGTNGKTTVTLLVEHVLNHLGIPARSVGNIGKPLTEYFVHSNPEEVLVVELSSYQLETLHAPVFDGGVILNITPDHLDHYDSFDSYKAAKCYLQRCIKKGAPLLIHPESESVFGQFLTQPKMISYHDFGFKNRHDNENASSAFELVKLFDVSFDQFVHALKSFKKPSHRIEFVGEWEGVAFFDDSKGTNLDAVLRAVESMTGKVLLIAGGVDKGASYAPWIIPFANKVKKIFTIGQAASKIENELAPFFEISSCSSLEVAVKMAAQEAEEGECVLLSPGCASFDMFRDYAHRGEEFKRYVQSLRRKP